MRRNVVLFITGTITGGVILLLILNNHVATETGKIQKQLDQVKSEADQERSKRTTLDQKVASLVQERTALEERIRQLQDRLDQLQAAHAKQKAPIQPPQTSDESTAEDKVTELLGKIEWKDVGKVLYDEFGKSSSTGAISPDFMLKFVNYLPTLVQLQKLLNIHDAHNMLNHERILEYIVPSYLEAAGHELTDDQKQRLHQLSFEVYQKREALNSNDLNAHEYVQQFNPIQQQFRQGIDSIVTDPKALEVLRPYLWLTEGNILHKSAVVVKDNAVNDIVHAWTESYHLDPNYRTLLEPIARDFADGHFAYEKNDSKLLTTALQRIRMSVPLNDDQLKKLRKTYLQFHWLSEPVKVR